MGHLQFEEGGDEVGVEGHACFEFGKGQILVGTVAAERVTGAGLHGRDIAQEGPIRRGAGTHGASLHRGLKGRADNGVAGVRALGQVALGVDGDLAFQLPLEVRREGIVILVGARAQVDEELAGIRHLVALRGDLPSGSADAGEFRYANELVAFIRDVTGDWFHIDVACYPEYHPQAASPAADLASFKRKIDAGADSAITQYFFNADSYYRFVDAATALGITVPIVPGVMPITSFSKLARFSDACGAEIPRWIRRKMESFGDDTEAVRDFGLDVVTRLCADLLAHGAPGLHFYTLNQASLTTIIWQRLSL